jgi:hypothetical protein
MKINKKANTRDAVETSIDLAKDNKNGRWEGINNRELKGLVKWEDISLSDLNEIFKKAIPSHMEGCGEQQ